MRLLGDALCPAGLPEGPGTNWRLRACPRGLSPPWQGTVRMAARPRRGGVTPLERFWRDGRAGAFRAAARGWQPPGGAAGARRGASTGVQVADSELVLPDTPKVVPAWEGRGVRAPGTAASLRCQRLSRAAMPPRFQRLPRSLYSLRTNPLISNQSFTPGVHLMNSDGCFPSHCLL